MGFFTYNFWRKQLFKLFFLTLGFILIFSIFFSSFFNACLINRYELNISRMRSIKSVLQYMIFALILTFAYFTCLCPKKRFYSSISFINKPPTGFNYRSAFSFSICVFWYFITYMVCVLFKYILNDHNCSKKMNSVSGHYLLYFYYNLSLPYLTFRTAKVYKSKSKFSFKTFQFRKLEKNPKILFVIYLLILSLSSITLLRTYIFGFHSLKQNLYGVLLAIISHYLLIYFLSLITRKGFSFLLSIISTVYLGLTLLLFILKIYPYSFGEVITSLFFFSFCFLLIWTQKVKIQDFTIFVHSTHKTVKMF